MARPLVYSLSFVVVALVVAPLAWAQQQRGGQNFGGQQQQSQFGQQQFGGQQQGFGNTGFGATGQATGSTGSSGMFGNRASGGVQSQNSFSNSQNSFGSSSSNSGTFGSTGSTGATNQQQQMMGSQNPSGQRYTREGRQPGAFVGADTGDAANLMSQMQGNMISSLQGLQQAGNQQNQFNQMNSRNNQNTNNRVQVRASLKLGSEFRPSVRTTSPVAVAKVQARILKTPQLKRLGPIQLTMEGRTAVLRGTVESEHARALAEKVALLEPGISAVKNDLIVGPVGTTEQAGN